MNYFETMSSLLVEITDTNSIKQKLENQPKVAGVTPFI